MFFKDQPVKIVPAIKRNFCLGSILFDLIEGTSTKRISTNQACLPTFLLIIVGHLSHTECVTYLISDTSSLILSLQEHFGVMYNFYDRNIPHKFTAVIIMESFQLNVIMLLTVSLSSHGSGIMATYHQLSATCGNHITYWWCPVKFLRKLHKSPSSQCSDTVVV